MSDFLPLLSQSLESYSRRARYLVAVSGGRDSVALLHGLVALGFQNLVVCHFNHRLRGAASRGDAKFVAQLAQMLTLDFEGGEENTAAHAKKNKLSIETAAREMRHTFLAGCAKKYRTGRVFLAHHAEDQVETCLFNYLRGAGIAGLSGMKSVSPLTIGKQRFEILRPMLGIVRTSIESFLKENGIDYREDCTNSDLNYSRNRIRHRILSYLEKALGRDIRKSILRTAEILSTEDEWMQSETSGLPLTKKISVKWLRTLPLALQRRFLRRWLIAEGVPEPDYADVRETLKLLPSGAKTAKANLPKGIHIRRREGFLFLEFPAK